jgi:single-strand DNA-binding protein
MTSLNKIQLIGRVGKEPLPHIFANGSKIIGFSLATSNKWKDKETQEWKEKTEWHAISVTNSVYVDYIVNQVNKGDLIYLEGELRYRTYTKKDGTEATIPEICVLPYAGECKLLKSNDETAKTYKEPVAYDKRKAELTKAKQQAEIEGRLEDDDVPF